MTNSNPTRIACVCGFGLAIFVVWVATARSVNPGLAFSYAIPVGLATWWWGKRIGGSAPAPSPGWLPWSRYCTNASRRSRSRPTNWRRSERP